MWGKHGALPQRVVARITSEQSVECGWLVTFTQLLPVETMGRVKARVSVPGIVPVSPG